jgi:hypothetical protein
LRAPIYEFNRRRSGIDRNGLPHSEIRGSGPICARVVPFEGSSRNSLPSARHRSAGHLSWGGRAFQSVVCDQVSARWVRRSRHDVIVSDSPARFSSGRRPPSLARRVHPLIRFASPPESFESPPARRLPTPSTFLGVPFPFATSTGGVHYPRGFPSPLRSALDVSHVLDGLLLHAPRGLVSSHNHVQDSRFRGFPRCRADPPRRRTVPSCRYVAFPCLRLLDGARARNAVFRALIQAAIRCDLDGV